MKQFARQSLLVTVILTIVLVSQAQSGHLSQGLISQISNLKSGETIKVLVVMRDQADIKTLDQQLHQAKAPLATRHKLVLELLQDKVKKSQSDLLVHLATKKQAGQVVGYSSHWLVNSVVVEGTVVAIEELAARDDVEIVEADLVPRLIEPLPGDQRSLPEGGRGIGLTQGVQAVNAPRVWRELGLDGTGVIVGILDTGVDALHPALNARWRGNFAPAEECWYDATGLGNPDFPTDLDDVHGHGTHVMGTITGLAPGDTIGVAPGALWIAANPVVLGGTFFDNQVISSLEFMSDPDGDPETISDVPAVVQNSWGVYEYFGYFDCDSRWWDAIDNCEAAGVALTWSAGNSGADGAATILSPADRATSATNSFSVGSTSAYPPYTISYFSSRGPSGCGGAHAIKPEVCAPGSDIYSAQPGGGYQILSGTSMAGPHVAGVVALMRAANPDVDVITIKEVLMATAVDLGAVGEDNNYGQGFVDAYAAVLAVSETIGSVTGTVTDAQTIQPVAGVTISFTNADNYVLTNAQGEYEIYGIVGPVEVIFAAYGYETSSINRTINAGESVVADQVLSPLQVAPLTGTVIDAFGFQAPGVTVSLVDLPVEPVLTNEMGEYSFSLAMSQGLTYQLQAKAPNIGLAKEGFMFSGPMVVDLQLQITENFESGDFSLFPWQTDVFRPWIVDPAFHFDGGLSARSAEVSGNEVSRLSLDLDIVQDGNLNFWYKMNSNEGNHLYFELDGEILGQWFGTGDWQEFTTPVAVGHHTFTWTFEDSNSPGMAKDLCWIDYIQFPPAIVPGIPQVVVDPLVVAVSAAPESAVQLALSVSNTGDGVLEYSVFSNSGGEVVGARTISGLGGPDNFGYSWVDNTETGGPQFHWIDISATGINIDANNDSNHGPFDLGFDFPFYGTIFDEVRITSNGFLSFSWFLAPYSNQPIPSGGPPNDLLAVFWDDLNPAVGGDVYYLADITNGRFIVQYEGVFQHGSNLPQTFEVILNADGSILYQYLDVTNTESCTVGIENSAGDDGLQVVYNDFYLQDELAIRFATDFSVPWLTVSPQWGAVPPDDSAIVMLNFDTHGLEDGVYQAGITILSDDPDNGVVEIPVSLTVGEVSHVNDFTPECVKFLGAVPNPFNPQTQIKFSLPMEAQVDLEVYDISGRLVRDLHSGFLGAGNHSVCWEGNNNQQQAVASGKFFARLSVDGQIFVKPLVLVR